MAKKVMGDFDLPEEGDIIDQITAVEERRSRAEEDKEQIRRQTDIVALFGRFGVKLSKAGKNFKGICPFHEETDASLSVDPVKGLFNCFGCGASGDVFSLVQKMKGCDFKEALAFLKNEPARPAKLPARTLKKAEPKEKAPDRTTNPDINLDTISNHYHQGLYKSGEAISYLRDRGFSETLAGRFNIGYADGSLLKLASNGQRDFLKEIGIIRDSGKEHLIGCLVFPIKDDQDRTQGFYGRSISPTSKTPHLYLKGNHKGIFNRKASKVYGEVILTECIIDCLSLVQLGIENVQAIYGTGGFTAEHLETLRADRVKTIILALDNDKPGREASEKYKEQLLDEGFLVKVIFPSGAKDWNEYLLQKGTKAEVLKQIEEAELLKAEPKEPTEFEAKKEGQKYLFTIKGLCYRLLGVKPAFVSSLRVNIRAEFEERNFLDNVDLYSARSRSVFSQNLAQLFGMEASRIEKDLLQIVEHLEEERDRALMEFQDKPVTMSDDDKALGLELLQDPKLFDRILEDTETLGYVGDETNKKLMYLAASSRKLDDPISVLVTSESGAGKSYLIDTVKDLIPPEEVVSMTSLSDQALNYLPEEGLINKFLVMGEAVHSEPIEHQIREMLSAHELSRLVTTKDEKTGQLISQSVRKKVIVSAAMSTTNHNINPENMSRFFVVQSDESRKQTKRIHEQQQRKYTIQRYTQKTADIPRIIKQHWCAQRLLRKVAIVNPFAKLINFPDSIMRTRRDYERFLDLIASVCYLRQYQKDEKQSGSFYYIECDIDDYHIAYEIMAETLPMTLNNFPQGAVNLYECVRNLIKQKADKERLSPMDVSITQKEIREQAEFTQRFIKRYMQILADYEILIKSGSGYRGARNSYKLAADEDIQFIDLSMIPAPSEVEKQLFSEELF